jgi:hypothetical protein
MMDWLRKRSPGSRILVYPAAAVLAFAMAAGVGAMGALMLPGDGGSGGSPGSAESLPPNEQGNAAQSQQKEDASQQSEAEYVARVGDIQADSVETFLDSHDRLLRYDTLTADDVEEMQANQEALQEFTKQVDGLDPPQRYGEQYEAFRSAISELRTAAKLAHNLTADPTAATQSGFGEYDRHVNEAAAGLKRSNEILGRDYKTIEGVQRVNLLS